VKGEWRQLLEDGLLVLGDSGYELTEKGRQRVQKELERYKLRPAMLVLNETHILRANECSVW
jgi:Mn-dependent DtxR family transcriptional regulator